MRSSRQVSVAVPCLLVTDLGRAVAYYRDTLGFATVALLEDPPVAAYVRRGPSTLLLQVTDDPDASVAEVSRRRLARSAWDALVLVDDVESLVTELRSRGAKITVGLGVTHVSDHTLEVRDPWGNLLAFAGAPVSLVRRATETLRRLVPAPVRHRAREIRSAREEREPAAALRRFCADLDGTRPFYMFFTRDLLHWVRQAAIQVPAEVTLALIGSDLPAHEVDWLRRHVDRPFHNIELGVDDNTTWEFLFDAHEHDFGWMDIDCFVLEPGLFEEMTRFDDDVALNGMWTFDAAPGARIACSHFAFVNTRVLRTLRAHGDAMSPTNYDWVGSTLSLLHPRSVCRVPTEAQRRLLLKVLPPDELGRPTPPGGMTFFDTLVCFQVGAYARGYRTRAVRPLVHRTQDEMADATSQPVWQQDMSDEIVHVGAVSYYHRDFQAVGQRAMYLAAESAMITAAGGDLPASYATRQEQLVSELAEYGLDPEAAVHMLRAHLLDDRGLSGATADRVLGAGR